MLIRKNIPHEGVDYLREVEIQVPIRPLNLMISDLDLH